MRGARCPFLCGGFVNIAPQLPRIQELLALGAAACAQVGAPRAFAAADHEHLGARGDIVEHVVTHCASDAVRM